MSGFSSTTRRRLRARMSAFSVRSAAKGSRSCAGEGPRGRVGKAMGSWEAAGAMEAEGDTPTTGDASVTLGTPPGIAAVEAICWRALGGHAQGESHDEATALLRLVIPGG